MTGPTEQGALPLPGLDDVRPGEGPLAKAVRRTIAAHQAQSHLGEVDAGRCAIALELCAIVQAKQAQGRLSTVSNDLRLLTELLAELSPEGGDEANEGLRKAMDAWEAEIREQERREQERRELS